MTYIPDFSRQLRLDSMSEAQQKKLAETRVLVFGAGGLGVTALSYLVGAGIGQITIVDPDRIDSSNLHRQTIYQISDIGNFKAEVAAHYLRQRSSLCKIEAISQPLEFSKLHQLCEQQDIILDCTDDQLFSYQLNALCLLLKKIVVFANAVRLEGQLFVLHPDSDKPCFNCLWPRGQYYGDSCDQAGVLGPVPGMLGCLQALEAIKLLTEHQKTLSGQLLHCDFSAYQFTTVNVPKSEHCMHSMTYQDIERDYGFKNTIPVCPSSEIDISAWICIDIRSEGEVSENPYPFAEQHIEMAKLADKPEHYLVKDKNYLLVCATGKRSQLLSLQLQKKGYSVVPYKRAQTS